MRAIDYFDKGAEEFPGRIAIIDRITQYSYRDAQEASRRIAKAMWACGLRGEERVAIFSPNDARVLLCMLGLMRAGGVWVPINYRNALDANVQFLSYSETSWLFYHSSFEEQVPNAASAVRKPLPARYSDSSMRISRSSSTTKISGCAFMA